MANNYTNHIRYGQAARPRALTAAAAAAAILGKQSSSADLQKIIRLLAGPDANIRRQAVKNLAALGSKESLNALVRAVNDSDFNVRVAACDALGALRAHSAKAALYDSLHDPNPYVRIAAASALAAMGDSFGLSTVVTLLKLPGQHRLGALQCFNRITRKNYPINNIGIDQAIADIKKMKF